MSRTSPSRVNLLSANSIIFGDVVGADIGKVSSTLSLVDEVYRVDIEKSGVLGVASAGNFRGMSSNYTPIIRAEGDGTTALGGYGISYTLAKDSNGNKILDSGDQFIDRKSLGDSGFKDLVIFQKNVTPGTYFVELGDANGSSRSLTESQILFDPGENYGETLGNIPDPKGITVAQVKQNPSVFMDKIRDYDGNNLGSGDSWKLIGDADVQGDGDMESIFVNPLIGRWATVGVVNNFNIVNFSNHGQGGDTRVVGIYIDPTLKDKPENIGGPFDSQRRFQNDLRIDNLRLLAAADYNKDGFQDMYFKVSDGTAVLRALMHADGNIQYANYQSKADLTAFMTANNVSPSIWSGWI
ncbi:hypothetical protein ACRYJJ_00665 [Cylindrospermopsis raciborskii G7]|uniref:hypothetical protein n=1 Tax=Cylindrospermopsis raciborskii TaxID=77022 RepID=UPI003EBD48ED